MAIFTNQAQITYNGRTILSNVTQGEITDPVSITKTALGDTYSSGETKTFVITLTNTSTSAITNITITDNLGEYAYGSGYLYPLTYTGPILQFINGTPSGSITPTTTAPGLTFVVPALPAGGNVTLVYDTVINSFAQLGADSAITNTAVASGDGIVTPITASETINAATEAILSLIKAVTPTSVTDGTLTYTITIENNGNTAADTLVLTDTFDPILSTISVTLNGTALTEATDYTYDTASGLFTIPAGKITVPAATYQTSTTGETETIPGSAVVTISGNI